MTLNIAEAIENHKLYMENKFCKRRIFVNLDGQEMPKSKCFQYLGLIIIRKDEKIEENMNRRIRTVWMKWRSISRIVRDR